MNCLYKNSKIVIVILIGLAFNRPALSALIDLDTGVGNGADSYISSLAGKTNTNFGTLDTFDLKNDAGTGFLNRKGYLRFDHSSVNDPINNASLRLSFVEDNHATFATWTFNVYGLSDGHSGENWLETGITWNNAPANNTSSGGLLGDQALLLGSFTIDTSVLVAGDIVNFSSSGLTNFIQNDTNDLATLILVRQDLTFSNVSFATKEHIDFAPPTLALSTTVVPIPSAVWLFGSGLLGLIGVARRKKA